MTKEIGKKIRQQRKKQGLTLERLETQTGMSRSYLSNLERGLTEPSVGVLKKIAAHLNFNILEFFIKNNLVQDDSQSVSPVMSESNATQFIKDVKVVTPDQRKTFTLPGSTITYELLTPDLKRQFEVMTFRAKPGETSGKEPIADPYGEKFILVINGIMEIIINDKKYTLQPGETIYFPADAPTRWISVGKKTLEVIVVLFPPWF